MESLSDNILVNCLFVYLDWAVSFELVPLRLVNKRFNKAVVKFYKFQVTSPLSPLNSEEEYQKSFGVYIDHFSKEAIGVSGLFEELEESLDEIDKFSLGRVTDHISQSNQNSVSKEVLKLLDCFVLLFDLKLSRPNTHPKMNRTQTKKEKVVPYLEMLSEYWRFKNNFHKLKVTSLSESKRKRLKKKFRKIRIQSHAEIPVFKRMHSYIETLIRLTDPLKRPLVYLETYLQKYEYENNINDLKSYFLSKFPNTFKS